jgi:O-antigen/teichoic acid export membrane protein
LDHEAWYRAEHTLEDSPVTSSRLLARNTALNVVAQLFPMAAAVVAIPILIRHLGAPRFGVLTLAWAMIGYFGLFDLGLGRALTQAVAARLGDEREHGSLTEVSWTALFLMLGLGAAGGLVVAGLTPWIVHRGLHVPAELMQESLASFYLLGLSLPFVVTTAGLRGLMEAHQDFGLATALRIPLALFTFLAPLAALPFSVSLVPIVAILVAGRVLAFIAHLIACVWRYNYLRSGVQLHRRVIAPLLRLGGWMTVSNVVSPLMAYLDRFFIGAILPLAAVAYYVTPFEVVSKLLIVPSAMIAVFFPAFASSFASDRRRTAQLFERSMRIVLLFIFPLLLAIMLFAHEGLAIWVGPEFADASAPVLRWLAVGIFLNSLAQPPFAVLQGIGRPDITAKLHLIELPIYIGVLWWLAHRYGIVGVAAAWTIRVGLDTTALVMLAHRLVPAHDGRLRTTVAAALGLLIALGAAAAVDGLAEKVAFMVIGVGGFVVLGWTRLVPAEERQSLRRWARPSPPAIMPPAAG